MGIINYIIDHPFNKQLRNDQYMLCTDDACKCRCPAVKQLSCCTLWSRTICAILSEDFYKNISLSKLGKCPYLLCYGKIPAAAGFLQKNTSHPAFSILTHACNPEEKFYKRTMDHSTWQSAWIWSHRSLVFHALQTAPNDLWPKFFMSFESLGQSQQLKDMGWKK